MSLDPVSKRQEPTAKSDNSPSTSNVQTAATANSKQRKEASSANVGMVPSNSEGTNRATNTVDSASPAPKPLSPQARKQQKLQTQLERAIAQSFPESKDPSNGSLIAKLEPKTSNQSLAITLNNSWYQLDPTEQDGIAAAIWSQKGPLKLKGIQLQDATGKTIARSPVVGDQMVIVRR